MQQPIEIRVQEYDPDTLKVSSLPADCLDAQNLALTVAGEPQDSAEILRKFCHNFCPGCRRTGLQQFPSYAQLVTQIDGVDTLLCLRHSDSGAHDDSFCLRLADLAVNVTSR